MIKICVLISLGLIKWWRLRLWSGFHPSMLVWPNWGCFLKIHQNFSQASVREQISHYFSVSALPIWNGLKALKQSFFEEGKQINRCDPSEIPLWYLGHQPGNAFISLQVTPNAPFCGLMNAHFSVASRCPFLFPVVFHQAGCVSFFQWRWQGGDL